MRFNRPDITLGIGHTIFMSSDHRIHSVPTKNLWQAYGIDPNLIVLADSPEGWQEFVRGQAEIERQWNLRHVLTSNDRLMLREMGTAWDRHTSSYLIAPIIRDCTSTIRCKK
jgi:hypothetical protein